MVQSRRCRPSSVVSRQSAMVLYARASVARPRTLVARPTTRGWWSGVHVSLVRAKDDIVVSCVVLLGGFVRFRRDRGRDGRVGRP